METKFSIIIPCYNQAKFIHDCYVSIISQNYYVWEIIFVNDGSTDDTLNILNRIQLFDNKVFVLNKENGGLSSARNTGIKAASGNYIIFLDCDDMLLPNCLSSINKAIEKKQKLDIIQVGYRHIDELGISTYTNVLPALKEKMFPTILFNNLGPVHSFCISKNLVDKIGFFDENLKSCEDWDYWIRSSFIADEIDTIHIVLVDYRMNSNSMSRDSFTLYNALKEVALRGKEEFKKHQTDNLEVEEHFKNSLKQKLALCLGVGILQNKINDAAELLLLESKQHHLEFKPKDFKLMSSYLTFRYRTSQIDVKKILNEYKPLYINFFKTLGYNRKEIKKNVWVIFSKHYYLLYKKKYGAVGSILFKLKSKLI